MSTEDIDVARRRFLTGATSVVGAIGTGFVAVPFISSWQPSARAKAIGAPVEIDISKLGPGQRVIELWQGKPVWVIRRTPESLEALPALDKVLRDPDSEVEQQPAFAQNKFRSLDESETVVLVGICTHLGCSPLYVTAQEGAVHNLDNWQGGFFCPCHGSKFDLAGRVYSGVPAPTNLVVPPYKYLSESTILIGVSPEEAAS